MLKNNQLASDILAVIEEIQFLLESYLKVGIKKLDSTDSFRLHSIEMDAAEDREWLKFSDNLQSCMTDKKYTKTRNELIALKSINRAIPDINQRFRTEYFLTEATDQCVQAITLHGQEVKRSAKKERHHLQLIKMHH